MSSRPVPFCPAERLTAAPAGMSTPAGDSSTVWVPAFPTRVGLYRYSSPEAPAPEACTWPSSGPASDPSGSTRSEESSRVMPGSWSFASQVPTLAGTWLASFT